MKPIRIGITCGDVNGIGPEIVLKAVSSGQWKDDVEFILIGPNAVFNSSNVWSIPFSENVTPGKITAEASKTAVAAIERAVRGCLDGELDAMVTAPICKEGLKLAGYHYPGHTEMIADLTGTTRYGMMLMGKGLRVMLATRHLPLRAVADALTQESILEAIELTGETLTWFGLQNGRIGVCGLNPHAGDGGALGCEESTLIAPAIEAACAKGFNAIGPVPADVIFYQALKNQYDAVVAMYHDQGLGPLKMHAFDCGINLTPGLPIVRTSPDHGTAFDIAGQGIANADSMIAAIETAIQLAGRINPWGGAGTGAGTAGLRTRALIHASAAPRGPSSSPRAPMEPRGWHSRGYLPHFDSNDVIQHVTFHLADSLPADVVERLMAEIQQLDPERQDIEKRRRLEALVDAGHGACWLQRTDCAQIVQNALLHFDGDRYRMIAWVVMPNHVHVLFQTMNGWSMNAIVGSWKTYTANAIGRVVGQPDEPLPHVWHPEFWDRFIRDENHFASALAYIHNNPVKAGLVSRPEDWSWSSAYSGSRGSAPAVRTLKEKFP